MNARNTNLALHAATALFALGTVAAIALGLLLPVESQAPTVVATGGKVPATTQATDTLPLASFEPIFYLQLRRNLAEMPAVATNKTPSITANNANPSNLPITLVGTIGDSIALIQAGADIQAIAVGETSAGAKVLAIRPSQIDIEYAGQKITLNKPKSEDGL